MPIRTLRFPDLPEWHNEPNFSFPAREALITAYTALRRQPRTLQNYADAFAAIEPHRKDPMTPRQYIRAFYVLGMAFAAVDNYPAALVCIEDALDLGYDLNDPGELLDLLYAYGSICRGMLRYSYAAMAYRDYLDVLTMGGAEHNASDIPLELDARIQLAGAEFFLAHYDEATEILAETRRLLSPQAALISAEPELRLLAATTDWFQALIERWRERPHQALPLAINAGITYTELGSPISAARSQLIVADVKLDLAERADDPARQYELALESQPHIERARGLAADAADLNGMSLVSLVDVRLSRLTGRAQDRIAAIKEIAKTGQRLEDEAVVAQAYTSLADELHAQGAVEDALYRYREVRHLLDGSDVPALGIWALRAAHRIEGLSDR